MNYTERPDWYYGLFSAQEHMRAARNLLLNESTTKAYAEITLALDKFASAWPSAINLCSSCDGMFGDHAEVIFGSGLRCPNANKSKRRLGRTASEPLGKVKVRRKT